MPDVALSIVVSKQEQGRRLDDFVAQHANISRAHAVRLIQDGQVRVSKRKAPKGYMLQALDVVELAHLPMDPQSTPPEPQIELPLSVLYEDQNLVIVNKPVGWPSHPLRPGERGTLASALLARYPECAGASEHSREGGLCHRLDLFTSGVIVAARNRAAWMAMRQAFADGVIDKEYWALCQGAPQTKVGEIKLSLLPASGQRDRMIVAETKEQAYQEEALFAHTKFQLEKTEGDYSLLKVWTFTGRRHQIRAHLSYLGLPLYGDELYGGPPLSDQVKDLLGPVLASETQGQFLHAKTLRIPALQELGNKTEIQAEAPLPSGRKKLLELLGFGEVST